MLVKYMYLEVFPKPLYCMNMHGFKMVKSRVLILINILWEDITNKSSYM